MAEQDPLEYTSQRFEAIKKEALEAIRGTGDLDEGWQKAQEAAEEYYKQMKQQKALMQQLGKEYEKVFAKAEKKANKFVKPIEKISGIFQKFPIDKFFDQDKIDGALSTLKTDMISTFEQSGGGFSESIASGITEGLVQTKGVLGALGRYTGTILSAAKWAKLGAGISSVVVLIGFKMWSAIKKVDEATADLVSTTGILDDSLSFTLIRATEQSSILGGNVQLAADAMKELVNQFSVSVPISSQLVGNVATLSERFGLGNENATKLVRIISERLPVGLSEASVKANSIVESLGMIGPAVTRNIVESYEKVNDNFGLSINQLRRQGLLATQLGISLSDAAEASEGLLDLSSSITSEFRASALLGGRINLQRARQLAFEGDIVGANQEILNQVEKIGDISRLNTFQRQALAQATGKTVSELQRELNIRRRIGDLGRVEAARRESVLGKFEAITRRIQAQFFRVFASPEVQNAVNSLADGIIKLLDSDKLTNFANYLGSFLDKLGRWIGGEISIERNFLGIPIGFSGGGNNVQTLNDGIITNRGEVVSTNPRDYIIATQNPAEMMSGDGSDKETKDLMREVSGLLKDLKENGIKAETYMDGRKVSRQLAQSNR